MVFYKELDEEIDVQASEVDTRGTLLSNMQNDSEKMTSALFMRLVE